MKIFKVKYIKDENDYYINYPEAHNLCSVLIQSAGKLATDLKHRGYVKVEITELEFEPVIPRTK